MLPGLYPDRDPGILFSVAPASRPFPVVVDADELLREVTYRGRSLKEPLLLSLARHRLARLLATDRVWEEVERDLPRYAGKHAHGALRAWREEYLPLIRWVAIPDRLETGFRASEHDLAVRMELVMERHSADAPTAELALLCAPCFVITGNHKHLHVAGFGDTGTRDALVAAGDAAELELAGIRTLSLGELGARGTWSLTTRTVRLAGDSPIIAGLMLAALLFLGIKAYERRGQLKAAAGRTANATMELIQELTTKHADLLGTLIPSLVSPLQQPMIEAMVAQALVRAPAPLSAEAVGYACRPTLDREIALTALRGHSGFAFWAGRGWTLGRHLKPPVPPAVLQREISRA
jgi:hypothetical protein